MWDVEVDDVFSMLFEEQGGSAPEAGGETNGLGSLWLSWQTSDPPDIRNTWQNFDKPLNGWSAASLTSQQPGVRLVTTQAPFSAIPNMQRSSTDLSSSSSSVIQVSNSLSSDPCSSTLPSRSSSGMAAEGSSPSQYIQIGPEGGWQSLLSSVLDDPPPAALAVPPAPSRRGRKPTGGTTKPVKDKKRENRILIKQLEQDLANKLNIVKQLEGQNVELKRKEKLLKLSVDTSEHNMTRLVDPGLDRSLKHMLQSFRSAYNRSTAERVLSKIGHIKEPKDMNFQVFCTCWNALVMEMCDSLMADATASTPAAKQESERHMSMMYHKTIDFVTAMCVHDCNIIVEAQQRNLVTGELLTDITLDFWSSVVDKMDFSDEQLKDLVGAYDMFVRCNERNLKERQAVKEELAAAMALQEGELESHGHNTCHGAMAVQEASDRLSANLVRCNTLHTMISFLALRIMTPRQTAQMGMHSSPTFPSPRHVLAAAYHKAVAKGLAPARALTEWDIPLDMQHL